MKSAAIQLENGEKRTVRVADTFLSRLRGLMFRAEKSVLEPLLICPCNQIHMYFMNFSIRAIFIDTEGQVLDVQIARPWTLGKKVEGAHAVLEVPIGSEDSLWETVIVGQHLQVEPS